MVVLHQLWLNFLEGERMRTGIDSGPFHCVCRTKVCKEAARVKGPDKRSPSGIMSEYFLCVKGGVDAFLAAIREAVGGE